MLWLFATKLRTYHGEGRGNGDIKIYFIVIYESSARPRLLDIFLKLLYTLSPERLRDLQKRFCIFVIEVTFSFVFDSTSWTLSYDVSTPESHIICDVIQRFQRS